eukprot:scaffold5237_cov179-Amphora_coffeaeformis.AAC.15
MSSSIPSVLFTSLSLSHPLPLIRLAGLILSLSENESFLELECHDFLRAAHGIGSAWDSIYQRLGIQN